MGSQNQSYDKEAVMNRRISQTIALSEVGDFLGNFMVGQELEDYNKSIAIVLRCEDGRVYKASIPIYKIAYSRSVEAKVVKAIIKVVYKDYCKSLPLMDRKIREMYRFKDKPICLRKWTD